MWLPLPWPRRWLPLRHVASLIPPGGILYGWRSAFSWYFTAGACSWMEEKCDSTSPVRHVRIRSRRFRFSEQLDSSDTRDLLDPFLPTIKKQTSTMLSTKSPELSLIFNTRYTWQDTPKSSHIHGFANHKLRWQPSPEYPFDSHHLTPKGSWLLRHPMNRYHDYGTH